MEFIDTNVLIYAHDATAIAKRVRAQRLIGRLWRTGTGGVSIQVFAEFYRNATQKLGMASVDAELAIRPFLAWIVHTPAPHDLFEAIRIHRDARISIWDAMIVRSASELGASVLWTEDLAHGQTIEGVVVRNPFAGRARASAGSRRS